MTKNRQHPRLARAAVAGLLVLAACGDGSPVSDPSLSQPGVGGIQAAGFHQTVTVQPAGPASGGQMTIRSEVIYRGDLARDATFRVCGLDVDTDLKLSGSLLECLGYSATRRVAPGDTLRGVLPVVVLGPPGFYTLRVRHLLDPEVWVSLPLHVE
jgi:hypothetical protein